ncbi:MAG: hypothetical protein QF726_09130 [Alphaproteobacteria bacterium]|jgi:uncharacterized membrane protein YecN with MAPEG domain|nr:hypothetical protein [Alphaproteobacteria bacterium]MDP7603610.1 hypothetical protein [Alphaproteobacteria bacterium]HJP21829.1 hypothetical protein [Alphaproteobacteria bacterium]
MPLPVITAAFAGVFAIMGMMLSLYVSFLRSLTGIEYGDGGEIVLTRAIRTHIVMAVTAVMLIGQAFS